MAFVVGESKSVAELLRLLSRIRWHGTGYTTKLRWLRQSLLARDRPPYTVDLCRQWPVRFCRVLANHYRHPLRVVHIQCLCHALTLHQHLRSLLTRALYCHAEAQMPFLQSSLHTHTLPVYCQHIAARPICMLVQLFAVVASS